MAAAAISEFVAELKLGDKLLPWRNSNITWVWIFCPAIFGYVGLLMQILNNKPTLGSIEVISQPLFGKLALPTYPIEVIATGGEWTEGPLWVDNDDSMPYLLYSDTKQNRINRWEEGRGFFTVGKTLYLPKSGCKHDNMSEHCDGMYEPGSNGLTKLFPEPEENTLDMIMCQHGERAITMQRDNGTRTIIASHYKGKKFNSPNDLVFSPEGHLYFTDPTYGLFRKGEAHNIEAKEADARVFDASMQEQPHAGLYMIHRSEVSKAIETGQPARNVFLIDSKMSHPNGLAFSPGYSKLYVSNSDPFNAYWKVFDVNTNGLAHKGMVFFNATETLQLAGGVNAAPFAPFAPDGLKVDISGNIFAAGPGGVLIFSPEAQLIGRLHTDRPVSNVAFGDAGYLYMTATDLVLRKRFHTKPAKTPEFKQSKHK